MVLGSKHSWHSPSIRRGFLVHSSSKNFLHGQPLDHHQHPPQIPPHRLQLPLAIHTPAATLATTTGSPTLQLNRQALMAGLLQADEALQTEQGNTCPAPGLVLAGRESSSAPQPGQLPCHPIHVEPHKELDRDTARHQ